MADIRSDDEELENGLGSEILISGNHMARVSKRWGGLDPEKRRLQASLDAELERKKPAGDAVHQNVDIEDDYLSPGQLYSTDSGRLFHAGKILVVLVGLPPTSKTLLSVAITRYTRWLGVRTKSFHLSQYRKASGFLPVDFLSAVPRTEDGKEFRKQLLADIYGDIYNFFTKTKGQLAVYDALNIRKYDRKFIHDKFAEIGVKVLYIESIMTDKRLVNHNIDVALQSFDYQGFTKEEATKDYMERYMINENLYETMSADENLSFVKYINLGDRITVHNNDYGYLVHKIVFFLMNMKEKSGCLYFARCGRSDKDRYVDDEQLNEEGIEYSNRLTTLILNRIAEIRKYREREEDISEIHHGDYSKQLPEHHVIDNIRKELLVWTAPRKRTYDTAKPFQDLGFNVRQRSQLKQLNPGVIADMSEDEIAKEYPEEYKEYCRDRYHFRFPRAESYHDLAVRMEPLLLEMEHTSHDIVVIAHESTLRILYGYFMALSCVDLPKLDFTRNELVEISFSPFCNQVRKIPIL